MWSTARPVKKAMREAEVGALVPRQVVTGAAFAEAFDKLRHDINGKAVEVIRSRRAPAAGSCHPLPLTALLKAALEAAQWRQSANGSRSVRTTAQGSTSSATRRGEPYNPCGPLALLGTTCGASQSL